MRPWHLHTAPPAAAPVIAGWWQRYRMGTFLPLTGVWLMLVLIELFSHSYIPIDETRYVTVAWNMWLNGDYLVPTLNGMAYSHKPPLLFWLMNLGWAVFGVNDWWPRLVPSLFALGSLWLTMQLAARLWPHDAQVVRIAPVILMGSLLWTVFTTATMFDMLVTFFALLGMLGMLIAWQDRSVKGWLLLGLAIGGGLLAKGPAILLQLLPPLLLAPWWMQTARPRWGDWYGGFALALIIGVVIALAWAIPAGMHGGAVYRHEIFWGQTAERMVESFAHERPFWWYLPLLPVLLFPWLMWRSIWRGAWQLRKSTHETGVRFCLAWLLPVFVAFSLISGKQVHYLLPMFPGFALLAARALRAAPAGGRRDGMLILLISAAVAVAWLFLPALMESHPMPAWLKDTPAWGGMVLLCGSILLWLTAAPHIAGKVWRLMMVSVLAAGLLNLDLVRGAGTHYDVRPISQRLKQMEEAGVPVAHAGEYPGIYNFVGRLRHSPEVTPPASLFAWFAAHPDGRAIVYFDRKHTPDSSQVEFRQDYLDRQVGIVREDQWSAWCRAIPTQRGCAGG